MKCILKQQILHVTNKKKYTKRNHAVRTIIGAKPDEFVRWYPFAQCMCAKSSIYWFNISLNLSYNIISCKVDWTSVISFWSSHQKRDQDYNNKLATLQGIQSIAMIY